MANKRINKLLIANRGEIAVRIIRTCKELGIASVAVFSEADRAAFHVRSADEAYEIGPPSSTQSYLVQKKLLDVAHKAGVDAIHPGYGFLSENATFAEACAEAGIIFIGPPPAAMREMGDKTVARKLMQEAGIPLVPGTTDAVADAAEAENVAKEIGYPVLIKAAAGGGGKGMRIVKQQGDILGALRRAQSEARSAFGDGRVFIEKYIDEPRHVEFQILADSFGNVIHLFERECSIQRRHQKVIEEAPSTILSEKQRAEMGKVAIRAAIACGYINAGTIEFLVDKNLNYYFMEMNTRLQVEHPVTEWISGIDLVAEQIRIAEGEALGFIQDDLAIHGHAIESRVYAEDPLNDFLPDAGKLIRHLPPSGFGVRVDAGVEQGGEVPIFYDPLIAKLTVWGRTRNEAIRRMDRALAEYDIAGLQTTIPFCRFVMRHENFLRGDFSTQFVSRHFDPALLQSIDLGVDQAAAVVAVLHHLSHLGICKSGTKSNGAVPDPSCSLWKQRRRDF